MANTPIIPNSFPTAPANTPVNLTGGGTIPSLVPTASSFFKGTYPIVLRVMVGASGVTLMITGLIIMGLSSRAAGQVANSLIGGTGQGVIAKVAKAAV